MKNFLIKHCNDIIMYQTQSVVSGLPGHDAHAVVIAGLGELANNDPLSPMSLFWIIDQHFIVFLSVSNRIFSPCNKYEYDAMMHEYTSPATINCPLASDTPRTKRLTKGRLATVCQDFPPSFFRISELRNP